MGICSSFDDGSDDTLLETSESHQIVYEDGRACGYSKTERHRRRSSKKVKGTTKSKHAKTMRRIEILKKAVQEEEQKYQNDVDLEKDLKEEQELIKRYLEAREKRSKQIEQNKLLAKQNHRLSNSLECTEKKHEGKKSYVKVIETRPKSLHKVPKCAKAVPVPVQYPKIHFKLSKERPKKIVFEDIETKLVLAEERRWRRIQNRRHVHQRRLARVTANKERLAREEEERRRHIKARLGLPYSS